MTTKSKCCGCSVSDCGDGEFCCVQCDNKCNPITGEVWDGKPVNLSTKPELTDALSDEEFVDAVVRNTWGFEHDEARYYRNGLSEGLAEGRRRNAEERLETTAAEKRRIQQMLMEREEAAAREAWDAALETCGVATIYERFNKWWKQRRQK